MTQKIKSSLLLALAGAALLASVAFASEDKTQTRPTIQAIEPEVAIEGTKVTLEGTNLADVTKVVFAGKHDAKFMVANNHEIVVTVPEGATSGPIMVVTREGWAQSTESVFVAPGSN
jgi:nitrous oxidase accessory protein NosD